MPSGNLPKVQLHSMKPYQRVPIAECREVLAPIPSAQFSLQDPHLYMSLGAPYGNVSPFYLRRGVLDRLRQAQDYLQQRYPNWRIQIFDAYRPVAVQRFMVQYTLTETAKTQGFDPHTLTAAQRQAILEQVYRIWAIPNNDPAMPPPHSTGAAIDVTLVNAIGEVVNMGSPIDELSQRSHPNYFRAILDTWPLDTPASLITSNTSPAQLTREAACEADQHRQLLQAVMAAAGFQRHPSEWWHFSWGDQLWAWLTNQQELHGVVAAHYGRVE